MELFKLFGTIAINGDAAKKTIDETTEKAKKMSETVSEKLTNTGNKIIGLGGKLLPASLAVGGVGIACVKSAADAGAMESQFSQVFGSMAGKASENLTKIADSGGIMETRMKGSYTKIAAFAKTTGMDTSNALGLADRAMVAVADSAAFYDRSLEDTTESLQSFLKGNFENDAALGLSCTETTRNAAANELYGKSFKSLSEEQKQLTLLQMVEDANKLSGALGQSARESDTFTNQLGNFKQSVMDLAASIGEVLLPIVVPMVKAASEAIKKFSEMDDGVKKIIVTIGVIIAVAGPVLIIIGKIMTAVGTIISVAPKIAGVINTVKTAFSALNAIMLANPIMLIIAAIAALVAAFVYLWNNCEGFRQFWIDLWNNIKEIAVTVWEALKEFFSAAWQAIVDTATTVWSGLTDFFSGLWEGIKGIFSGIGEWFSGVFSGAKDLVCTAWDGVTDFFGGLWEGISTTTITAWEGIKGWLSTTWEGIKTNASTAFDGAKTVIGNAWDTVSAKTSSVWNTVSGWLSNTWNTVKTNAETNFNAAKNGISTAWETAKAKTTEVWGNVKGWLSSTWGNIQSTASNNFGATKNIISSVWDAVSTKTSSIWNSIKNVISNGITAAKNVVSSVLDSIKNKFSGIFESAKNIVSGAINKIKGFFNFSWSLPKIKLPHFNISGKFSLDPPSIPHFGVSWYKKAMDNPMLLDSPTIFGAAGNKLLGAGDGNGAEVVSGANTLMDMIKSAVREVGTEGKIMDVLNDYLPQIIEKLSRDIVLYNYIGTDLLEEKIISANESIALRTGGRA